MSERGSGIGGVAAWLVALGFVGAAAVAVWGGGAPKLRPEPIKPAKRAPVASAAPAVAATVSAPALAATTPGRKAPARPAPGTMASGPAEGGGCGMMASSPPAARPPAPAEGGGCGMMASAGMARPPAAGPGEGGACGCGAGGGGGCACGGAGKGAPAGDGACGCGGAGGGGGGCGMGGAPDEELAAPAAPGKIDVARASHAKGAHMDHRGHHGGYVGMRGDLHMELVRTATHEWRVYLSDAWRKAIAATGGKADLEFFGDAGALGRTSLVVSHDKGFFAGRMEPPAGASSVSIRVEHPTLSAPAQMDMPFPPVVSRDVADKPGPLASVASSL